MVYSLLLFERTPSTNLLRVQADNLDRPFDINSGMKLDLGSTAKLRTLAHSVGLAIGVPLREGVYVAVTGPNLETRAEYRMLRALGADVVGMSTVPEVITAVYLGMRVLGISIITDQCLPDALAPASLEQILAVAREAEPRLTALVRGVVERLN